MSAKLAIREYSIIHAQLLLNQYIYLTHTRQPEDPGEKTERGQMVLCETRTKERLYWPLNFLSIYTGMPGSSCTTDWSARVHGHVRCLYEMMHYN